MLRVLSIVAVTGCSWMGVAVAENLNSNHRQHYKKEN